MEIIILDITQFIEKGPHKNLSDQCSSTHSEQSRVSLLSFSEDSDHTEWMPRLTWFFAGRTLFRFVIFWGALSRGMAVVARLVCVYRSNISPGIISFPHLTRNFRCVVPLKGYYSNCTYCNICFYYDTLIYSKRLWHLQICNSLSC